MVVGLLHTFENNFRAQKVLLAAKYSGKEVQVDDCFELGKSNISKEFLDKFPLGKVPALDLPVWVQAKETGPPSAGLTESNAIAYYVANHTLRGGEEEINQARVLQWMFFSDNELVPAVFNYLFPILGLLEKKDPSSRDNLFRFLNHLNSYLETRIYLVGDEISLADICVATTLLPLFKHALLKEDLAGVNHLVRWFETIVYKKISQSVLGKFEFCSKIQRCSTGLELRSTRSSPWLMCSVVSFILTINLF
jgi:elongation factor 1-gamma